MKAANWLRKFVLTLLFIVHIGLIALGAARALRVELWWVALLNTFALWVYLPLIITVPLGILLRGRLTSVAGLIALVWGSILMYSSYGPLPRPAVPANAPQLRVITYNFLGWNRQAETSVNWLLQQNADILMLEEVTASADDPLWNLLRAQYAYEASIFGDNRILSRFPILESAELDLPTNTSLTRVLRAVISVSDQPIALYSVHVFLPNNAEPNIPLNIDQQPFAMMVRYNEIDRNADVRAILGALRVEPYPHIVAGDWNMSATSASYDHVSSRLIDAYRQGGGGLGMTWPVTARLARNLSWVPPLLRIDYIFHSDDFATLSASVGEAIGSDHYPVMATLALLPQ